MGADEWNDDIEQARVALEHLHRNVAHEKCHGGHRRRAMYRLHEHAMPDQQHESIRRRDPNHHGQRQSDEAEHAGVVLEKLVAIDHCRGAGASEYGRRNDGSAYGDPDDQRTTLETKTSYVDTRRARRRSTASCINHVNQTLEARMAAVGYRFLTFGLGPFSIFETCAIRREPFVPGSLTGRQGLTESGCKGLWRASKCSDQATTQRSRHSPTCTFRYRVAARCQAASSRLPVMISATNFSVSSTT